MGLKTGLDVLERENRLPVPEIELRIVQPRPSLSTEYAIAVFLVPLKVRNYEL